MEFYRRYSLAIGFIILAGIIVLLLASTSLIFSHGVYFIDTDLHLSTGQEAYVKTRVDFGDSEDIRAFPKEINDWQSFDYDLSALEEELGADAMLMRSYYKTDSYQSVFFLIAQANTESSLHSPQGCYTSQGYKIEVADKDEFNVSDIDWGGEGETLTTLSIPVKKLVIFKEANGEVTERRVVLYYYVKENEFASDDTTMIRISAIAPNEGSYEEVLQTERDFASEVFPYMFEPGSEEDSENMLNQLTDAGPIGYLVIIILFSIPVAIMIYPRIRKEHGPDEEI